MFHLTYFLTIIIKFWHFSSMAFIEKTAERVPMASHYNYLNVVCVLPLDVPIMLHENISSYEMCCICITINSIIIASSFFLTLK